MEDHMKRFFVMAITAMVLSSPMVFSGGGRQSTSSSAQEVVRLNIPEEPWLVPYDTPVSMTIVNSSQPGAKYELPSDTESENQWTRSYKKYLNIDIRTLWVSEDYNTNLNLSIASGDLPDVFSVNDVQFRQLKEADLLEDVTDAFNNNLSPRLKAIYDRETAISDVYRESGRLYGVPKLHYGYECVPAYMWLRKDWMEELDYTNDLRSVDDLLNRIQAMNTRYGTRGMAVDKSLDYLIQMAPIWHAAPKIWVDGPNGSIVYGSVQPEMKTALAAFADWYRRGLINPTFAEDDSAQNLKDVTAGKFGAWPTGNWAGANFGDLVNLDGPNAYFEPYALPSADGNPVKHPIPYQNDGVVVAKKGYRHGDAIVKMFDLYTFLQADARKYNILTREFQDLLGTSEHTLFHPSFPVYEAYHETQEYRRTGNESVLGEGAAYLDGLRLAREFLATGNLAPDTASLTLMRLLQFYGDRASLGIGSGFTDRNEYVFSRMWGMTPEEVNRYGSTLDDLLLEGFTLIILGQQPVSYFDTLVRNWYTAGGQEVTDAVNRMYRR
jgi:putative aldouronate transport system substrate-binding protein